MTKAHTQESELWREDLGEGYFLKVTTISRKDWEGRMYVYSPQKDVIASQTISLFANSPNNGEKAWWRRLAKEYVNTARQAMGLPPLPGSPVLEHKPPVEPKPHNPAPGPVSAVLPEPKEKEIIWQDTLDDAYDVRVVRKHPNTYGTRAGLLLISKGGTQLAALETNCYGGVPQGIDVDDWGCQAEAWVDDYEKASGTGNLDAQFPYL